MVGEQVPDRCRGKLEGTSWKVSHRSNQVLKSIVGRQNNACPVDLCLSLFMELCGSMSSNKERKRVIVEHQHQISGA